MFHSLKRRAWRTARSAAVTSATAVVLLEVTTKLPSQGRSSEAYHRVADRVVAPALRAFVGPEGNVNDNDEMKLATSRT